MYVTTKQFDWEILLIEDDPDARSVLSSVLEHHVRKLETASNAEQAMQILESMDPTLLIIDLGLPDMDGWELMAAIRSMPRLSHVPAVAMTAFHSNAVAQKAIEAGFIAYFPKPISLPVFVEDIARILEPTDED